VCYVRVAGFADASLRIMPTVRAGDGALLSSAASGVVLHTALCGNPMEQDMGLLAEEPAISQWHEFPVVTVRHQKMDPVQRRKDFETARAAARYATETLSETVYRLATITVADMPPLYWETWRAFCDAPDKLRQT
jgi:hypothetical protein